MAEQDKVLASEIVRSLIARTAITVHVKRNSKFQLSFHVGSVCTGYKGKQSLRCTCAAQQKFDSARLSANLLSWGSRCQ